MCDDELLYLTVAMLTTTDILVEAFELLSLGRIFMMEESLNVNEWIFPASSPISKQQP